MMHQLFVATKKEATAIFGSENFKNENGLDFLEIEKKKVIVTGIGKVNAAIALLKYIKHAKNDKIATLVGIAGAYRQSGAKVGDVAYIRHDHFVDEALLLSKNDVFSLKGSDELGFHICKGNKSTFYIPDQKLPELNANTVSILMGENRLSSLFYEKTKASIENMEGAAFAYSANTFNIKAVQIRSVSNYCGNRDDQEWDIKKAIQKLKEVIYDLSLLT